MSGRLHPTFEALDEDQTALDTGQGLSGLPGSILQMTRTPQDLISPAMLPVDPAPVSRCIRTST
jgi:hypothetical protein